MERAIEARIEQRDGKCDPVEAIMEIAEWARDEWKRLGNVVSESGAPDPETIRVRLQVAMAAVDWMSKAAPYIRPRLNAVEARVNVNVTVIERIQRAERRLVAA